MRATLPPSGTPDPRAREADHLLRLVASSVASHGISLDTILQGVADGITVQDASGALVYANEAAARIVGYESPAAMLRAPLRELMRRFEMFDEAGRPYPHEELPGRRALNGERAAAAVVRFRVVPTGEERWSVVKATPVLGDDGRIAFAINVFVDITERKRREETQRFLAEASRQLVGTLDYRATLRRVADLAVPALADWCVLDLLADDGAIRTLAVSHADRRKVAWAYELQRRYPVDPAAPRGVPNVLRTGRPELYPEISDALLVASARDAEHLRILRELGMTSLAVVPLTARGRTFGVLSLVWSESRRRFGDAELDVAEQLAGVAALAIDNARLYEVEQRFRQDAERSSDRASRLQRVTAALSEAATPAQVTRAILDQGVGAAGAQRGVVVLASGEDGTVEIAAASGFPEAAVATWRRFATTEPVPLAEAVRTGHACWIESEMAWADRYPSSVRQTGDAAGRAWAAVPLSLRGRALGAIGLTFAEARTFSAEERAFLLTLADLCAQALERAQLYQDARQQAATEASLNATLLALAQERDRALAESESERDRLQQILDVLPEAVIVADGQDRFAMLNGAATSLLGLDATVRSLPSTSSHEVFGTRRLDGTSMPDDELPLRRALQRGEVVAGEQLLLRNAEDGRDVPILVNSAPLRDRAGATIGAVAVFQDISAIKALDRQKDEFLAAVSHDLKNPLMGIRGQAQLLGRRAARGTLNEARLAEGLLDIESSTDRVAAMVEELLDLTRLQMGRPLDLERQPTDLVALARRVAEEAQRASTRHLLRVEEGPPELVGEWDSARLRRVLENLLSNAIKYSPGGSEITVRVDLDASDGVDLATLAVRDRGLGIPAADLPHVFERFHRGSNVRGRVAGTGIGLAGARQIVEQHGGTIDVDSIEGQGSTFTVRLPLQSAAAAAQS